MGEAAFAAPILPGKLEVWEQFNTQLDGERHKEFEASRGRHGITREQVWHQQTPMGDFAVVYVQGPGAESMMPSIGSSTDPFDVWFREQVKDIHGIDMTQPPPGPPPALIHQFDA